jgi:non-ribosomal peptide synthetase component F
MSGSRPDPAVSISESFTRRAQLQPDAIALEAAGHRSTYAALDADSNRLARRLSALGVRRGDTVGVLAERGLETVVSALGAMKAGAAYVPLDPESPLWRTRSQLSDAGAQCLLTPESLAAAAHDAGLPVLALDPRMRALAGDDPAPLELPVRVGTRGRLLSCAAGLPHTDRLGRCYGAAWPRAIRPASALA